MYLHKYITKQYINTYTIYTLYIHYIYVHYTYIYYTYIHYTYTIYTLYRHTLYIHTLYILLTLNLRAICNSTSLLSFNTSDFLITDAYLPKQVFITHATIVGYIVVIVLLYHIDQLLSVVFIFCNSEYSIILSIAVNFDFILLLLF